MLSIVVWKPELVDHISKRMADMHDAGYVHRDLKPGNVMWLPRQNRWTIIDFGCVARVGEAASLCFTLAYAAPEVVQAFELRRQYVESTPALDTWSFGVMAFELLTGAPAFDHLADGSGGGRITLNRCKPARSLNSVPIAPCHSRCSTTSR